MPEKNEVFHRTIGAIIANMISLEYNGYMAVVFDEIGNNYLRNKCEEAAKVETKVIERLKVIDGHTRKEIEDKVKFYSDLIFDVTAMDEDKQKRVASLVAKIKKESKINDYGN